MKKRYFIFFALLLIVVAYFGYFQDAIYRYRLPELNRQHQLFVQAFGYAAEKAIGLDGTQYIGNFVYDSNVGIEYTFIYNGTEEELVAQHVVIYYECTVRPVGCKNQTFSGSIDELKTTIERLAAGYVKGGHDIPIQTKSGGIAIILPFRESWQELIDYHAANGRASLHPSIT